MEQDILTSTKHILGIEEEYTQFDLDIITHINSAFSTLCQLGIGPEEGYSISITEPLEWDSLDVPKNQLSLIRTYIYLKARALFDPPTTSFLIEATNKQIEEHEWRLREFREMAKSEEAV